MPLSLSSDSPPVAMFRSSLLFIILFEYFALSLAQKGASLTPPTVLPNPTSSPASGSSTSSVSSLATSSNSTSSASSTSTTAFPSLSTYSACVSNCLQMGVARVNCTSLTEVNCYCRSSSFPAEVEGCINSNCPSELQTAQSLAQQFCNIASSSPTLTFPSPTSTGSSSSPPTSPSPSSSSTTPSSTASSLAIRNLEILSKGGVVSLSIMLGACIAGAGGIWIR